MPPKLQWIPLAGLVIAVALLAAEARAVPSEKSLGPEPGAAVNGLKLTLSADRTDLQMTVRQLRYSTPDTPRYLCETTPLKLVFTNVSDKPIKLNVYDLAFERIAVEAASPASGGVKSLDRPVNRERLPMQESDLAAIEPGKSLAAKDPLSFPGPLGAKEHWLLAPGQYRLRIVYSNTVDPRSRTEQPAFAGGAWTGTVISNEVTINALPLAGQMRFGPAVDGLRLGVMVRKLKFAAGEPVAPTLMLSNGSDKPLLVMPLLVGGETVEFEITGPDGKRVPDRGGKLDWDVGDYDKAVAELAPSKFVSKELSLAGFDLSRPGRYHIAASYDWANAKPPPGRSPATWTRGPIWTGKLRSGEVVFEVAGSGAATQPAGGAEGKSGGGAR